MTKCKWAGDPDDEYCKNCDGVTMEVDGNSISCEKCAGYEPGEEDVNSEDVDITPTEADKRVVEEAAKKLNKDSAKEETALADTENTDETQQNAEIKTKTTQTTNNKGVAKKPQNKQNKKATTVSKVKEEKKAVESSQEVEGEIKITSMRYTSGATIKKGDNYFKFIAEEEWDVSQVKDIEEAREKLWAKLNGEVDKQIEELNSLN